MNVYYIFSHQVKLAVVFTVFDTLLQRAWYSIQQTKCTIIHKQNDRHPSRSYHFLMSKVGSLIALRSVFSRGILCITCCTYHKLESSSETITSRVISV